MGGLGGYFRTLDYIHQNYLHIKEAKGCRLQKDLAGSRILGSGMSLIYSHMILNVL